MLQTEFEIKFFVSDRDILLENIKELWWVQVHPQRLMQRSIFDHTSGYDNSQHLRIRNNGDIVTMTYKKVENGFDITWVKEIEVEISDFQDGVSMLKSIWLVQRAYQETKREKWSIQTETWETMECCIDIRPGCPEFIEIEWPTQELVEKYVLLLWFDLNQWFFGTADFVYEMLGICSRDEINKWDYLTFDNYPGIHDIGTTL